MAFRSRELSVLAYANGFTLWHYRTDDSRADLLATGNRDGDGGYFDSASELLRPGDRIMATLLSAASPSMFDLIVTTSHAEEGVRVAPAGLEPAAREGMKVEQPCPAGGAAAA